jgi:hypothetical protein
MSEPSIYDQLAKEQVSELTITQLHSGTKVTAVDSATLDYWRGPITLHRVLSSSRTYANGLPIPEASAVATATVADASVETIKPTGTEIWQVQAIDSNVAVGYALFDGTTSVPLASGSDAYIPSSPLFLTPTLYLSISNGAGSEATVGLAYHKVSL